SRVSPRQGPDCGSRAPAARKVFGMCFLSPRVGRPGRRLVHSRFDLQTATTMARSFLSPARPVALSRLAAIPLLAAMVIPSAVHAAVVRHGPALPAVEAQAQVDAVSPRNQPVR